MILGTDCGANNVHTIPGWSIHEELIELVKAGLSPAEALGMATINAARWRGESATEGSVERGKVADLLILRSNPLEAIRQTLEIDTVSSNPASVIHGPISRPCSTRWKRKLSAHLGANRYEFSAWLTCTASTDCNPEYIATGRSMRN